MTELTYLHTKAWTTSLAVSERPNSNRGKEGNGMKKVSCIFLIILVSVMSTQPALAEKSADPKDYPWKTGYLNLGGYVASLDSTFRIGESNLGIGIDLDVEEFLGSDQAILLIFKRYDCKNTCSQALKLIFLSKLPFQGKNN
jgi:hypothetical protein